MKFKYLILNLCLIFLLVLSSCKNPFRYTDAREIPVSGEERVRKNIEEGRGVTLFGGEKKEEFLILRRLMSYGELQLKC